MFARTVLALILSLACFAGQNYTIPAGKKVFIDKMGSDLDSFLRAEFVKQKIDLLVVMTPDDADLILTGAGTEEQQRKWHQGWLTAEQDRTTGALTLLDKNTKAMIWAGEAGDRSLWWGSLSRGGQRKVAQRLVNKMKSHVKRPK